MNTFTTHRKFILSVFFVSISIITSMSQTHVTAPLSPAVGRWDLTVKDSSKSVPSWMEIYLSGNSTLVGQFVGSGGSARPVAHVYVNGNNFNFSIPPQWDKDSSDMKLEGTIAGNNITGSITMPDGKQHNYTAVRAPSLQRTAQPAWGKEIKLFNGKDVSGWHTEGKNQWVVESGVLKSPKSGSNILTDKTFTDFKLHIEFRCPKGSNSGVYLRGRYEMQIEDGDTTHPAKDRVGAIYGFLEPAEDAVKQAGEWQSYDATLTGRMVTVMLNGKTVISNREIPGITGGAINSNEGEPGPIMMQGDHGPIEYRNITITPAQ